MPLGPEHIAKHVMTRFVRFHVATWIWKWDVSRGTEHEKNQFGFDEHQNSIPDVTWCIRWWNESSEMCEIRQACANVSNTIDSDLTTHERVSTEDDEKIESLTWDVMECWEQFELLWAEKIFESNNSGDAIKRARVRVDFFLLPFLRKTNSFLLLSECFDLRWDSDGSIGELWRVFIVDESVKLDILVMFFKVESWQRLNPI